MDSDSGEMTQVFSVKVHVASALVPRRTPGSARIQVKTKFQTFLDLFCFRDSALLTALENACITPDQVLCL